MVNTHTSNLILTNVLVTTEEKPQQMVQYEAKLHE